MDPQDSLIALYIIQRKLLVSQRTLRRWLTENAITPQIIGKKAYITNADFAKLRKAVNLHRSLNWRAAVTNDLETLTARIDELERQSHRQQQERLAAQRKTIRMLMKGDHIPRILGAVTEYIKSTVEEPRLSARTITIALCPTLEAVVGMADEHPAVERWRDALHLAMLRGWTVRHLVCQSDIETNVLAARGLVTSILRFFHDSSDYAPYFYSESDVSPDMWNIGESHDGADVDGFIDIEGRPPLIISVGRSEPVWESPYSSPATDVVRSRLNDASDRSHLLFVEFDPDHRQYLELITNVENVSGSRGLFMHGLSQSTLTTELQNERAEGVRRKAPQYAERIEAIRYAHCQRIQKLDEKLNMWKASRWPPSNERFIRDICPLSALETYTQTGVLSTDDSYSHLDDQESHPLLPHQVAAHLKGLIDRLGRFPHYELALFDDRAFSLSPLRWRPFWMVSEGGRVILEVYNEAKPHGRQERDLLIRDEIMVQEFLAYFVELWENGDHLITDREQVIEHLWQAHRSINFNRTS